MPVEQWLCQQYAQVSHDLIVSRHTCTMSTLTSLSKVTYMYALFLMMLYFVVHLKAGSHKDTGPGVVLRCVFLASMLLQRNTTLEWT